MNPAIQVPSSTAVLAFEGVSLEAQPPYDVGLSDLSFVLPEGGLLLVTVEPTRPHTPVADLAQGLLAPGAGRICYRGEDWWTMSPDRVVELRGSMGRTFEHGGWISNLDVDENITLPQRYHTSRSADEVFEEARALAVDLGLSELPAGRPASVSRYVLRRAQWVRALLGRPPLILLERPSDELPAEWAPPLIRRLDQDRARGAAVVWITSRPSADLPGLRPTLQIDLRE